MTDTENEVIVTFVGLKSTKAKLRSIKSSESNFHEKIISELPQRITGTQYIAAVSHIFWLYHQKINNLILVESLDTTTALDSIQHSSGQRSVQLAEEGRNMTIEDREKQ